MICSSGVLLRASPGWSWLPSIVCENALSYGANSDVTYHRRQSPRPRHEAGAVGPVGVPRRVALPVAPVARTFPRPARRVVVHRPARCLTVVKLGVHPLHASRHDRRSRDCRGAGGGGFAARARRASCGCDEEGNGGSESERSGGHGGSLIATGVPRPGSAWIRVRAASPTGDPRDRKERSAKAFSAFAAARGACGVLDPLVPTGSSAFATHAVGVRVGGTREDARRAIRG